MKRTDWIRFNALLLLAVGFSTAWAQEELPAPSSPDVVDVEQMPDVHVAPDSSHDEPDSGVIHLPDISPEMPEMPEMDVPHAESVLEIDSFRVRTKETSKSASKSAEPSIPTWLDGNEQASFPASWHDHEHVTGIDLPCHDCGLMDCDCGHGGVAFAAGFEWVYARPQFESNVAFTVVDNQNSTSRTVTDTEFSYDFEFSPRIWAGLQSANGLGVRGSFWRFDHSPERVTGRAPANGMGSLTHPDFGSVDVSTSNPDYVFSAVSDLDAYALDLDITNSYRQCNWSLLAGAGVKYASIRQIYRAELRAANEALLGNIDTNHENDGIGPTFTLAARRETAFNLALFCAGRASILFGDGTSTFSATDVNSLTTQRQTDRFDVMPIGEVKVGADWISRPASFGRLFLRGAFEGQLWSGVGNAASEDGDMGFYGFTIGGGFVR